MRIRGWMSRLNVSWFRGVLMPEGEDSSPRPLQFSRQLLSFHALFFEGACALTVMAMVAAKHVDEFRLRSGEREVDGEGL